MLNHLLETISKDSFLETYWEKKPLHVTTRDGQRFGHLFSLDRLDHLLDSLSDKTSILAVKNELNATEGSGPKSFSSSDLGELYNQFANGHTLVLNAISSNWPPVRGLCADLAQELGFIVNANMYVTPKNATGFAPHFDDHDVFILQVSGEKRWRLYGHGPELPRPSLKNQLEILNQRRPDAGKPTRELTLQQGDLLYIPRGFIHSASARDTTSIHLTVGIFSYTWEELLVARIRALSKKHVALRKSLPVGILSSQQALPPEISDHFLQLQELIKEDLNIQPGLNLLKHRLIGHQVPLPSSHFCQLEAAGSIHLDTRLERRNHCMALFIEEPDYVALVWPNHFQQGPPKMMFAFEFIANNLCFTVRDIPGWYSDNEKCTLARKLFKAGLLQIAQENPALETASSTAAVQG